MYKYKGGGFLVDVPARNLTDDEARRHGIPRILRGGLYEYQPDEPKPAQDEPKPQQPDEKPGIFQRKRKGK